MYSDQVGLSEGRGGNGDVAEASSTAVLIIIFLAPHRVLSKLY